MHKLSVYLDTSIINFVHADDEPELRQITREFFDEHRHKYELAISDVVLFEINKTSNPKRHQLLLDCVRELAVPLVGMELEEETEVFALADTYISEKIIPPSKREDAIHLGISTVLDFDVLLSWNFRHLANLRKQTQVNAVNARLGYFRNLRLLNPMELMDED